MNLKMEITVISGISGDGFEVEIARPDFVLFKQNYRYGYNANYKKSWGDAKAPYTTDIIKALMIKYKIALEDIIVKPGVYVFSGKTMGDDEAFEFVKRYLTEL